MAFNYQDKQQISRALKARFGAENRIPELENKCVFTFSGANQGKKMIGCMTDAFTSLANPDMVLILALKHQNCAMGTYQFLGEFDMQDLVSSPNIFLIDAHLDSVTHKQLYQMADFLVYPSMGECPGLQVSEAQLCGTIPIVTGYTGLPEESCFEEFVIKEFTLMRGAINCFRAVVDHRVLAKYMVDAFTYWKFLNTENGQSQMAFDRYSLFMQHVEAKFKSRTWEQTAFELSAVFQAVQHDVQRIDPYLIKL